MRNKWVGAVWVTSKYWPFYTKSNMFFTMWNLLQAHLSSTAAAVCSRVFPVLLFHSHVHRLIIKKGIAGPVDEHLILSSSSPIASHRWRLSCFHLRPSSIFKKRCRENSNYKYHLSVAKFLSVFQWDVGQNTVQKEPFLHHRSCAPHLEEALQWAKNPVALES